MSTDIEVAAEHAMRSQLRQAEDNAYSNTRFSPLSPAPHPSLLALPTRRVYLSLVIDMLDVLANADY